MIHEIETMCPKCHHVFRIVEPKEITALKRIADFLFALEGQTVRIADALEYLCDLDEPESLGGPGPSKPYVPLSERDE